MDRLAELKSNYNPQNEVAIQITADQSPLHGKMIWYYIW